MKNEQKYEELIAANEPPVSPQDLLDEIEPILKDYFVGQFHRGGNGLFYKLPNNQTFVFAVTDLNM